MEQPGSKETPSPEFEAVVVTVSDSCAAGRREDLSGPCCRGLLREAGFHCDRIEVVPDDLRRIAALLIQLCDQDRIPLIVTTGGTGLSPRDVTPEATRSVLDREIPGFGEAMRHAGGLKNPRAILSRATAGLRGRSLLVNLPGSVRGVEEMLAVITPVLIHALEVAAGDVTRCGG